MHRLARGQIRSSRESDPRADGVASSSTSAPASIGSNGEVDAAGKFAPSIAKLQEYPHDFRTRGTRSRKLRRGIGADRAAARAPASRRFGFTGTKSPQEAPGRWRTAGSPMRSRRPQLESVSQDWTEKVKWKASGAAGGFADPEFDYDRRSRRRWSPWAPRATWARPADQPWSWPELRRRAGGSRAISRRLRRHLRGCDKGDRPGDGHGDGAANRAEPPCSTAAWLALRRARGGKLTIQEAFEAIGAPARSQDRRAQSSSERGGPGLSGRRRVRRSGVHRANAPAVDSRSRCSACPPMEFNGVLRLSIQRKEDRSPASRPAGW